MWSREASLTTLFYVFFFFFADRFTSDAHSCGSTGLSYTEIWSVDIFVLFQMLYPVSLILSVELYKQQKIFFLYIGS
jgi:hypothetical protein